VAAAKSRARRDAGKQVRTAAKREMAASINLLVRDIAASMVVESDSKKTDFRIKYHRVRAHRYKGWRYIRRAGGRLVQESSSFAQFRKRGDLGLVVRFSRRRAALRFPKAFRTASVGGGVVFLQRKGRTRYPLQAIVGTSPHGYGLKRLHKYAEIGRAAYHRRARYWIDRYTKALK
jgi:hypothetical protein